VEVADGHCDGWCHCEQTFGLLAEGDRDAVISIVNESVASKYASRALFNFPYMLTVRSDHRFAEQRSVTIGDLVNESLILPQRCTFLQDVTNALTSLGRAARIIYRTDHDDWALELVAAGLGLAFVPGFFKISTIKQVPVSGLGISRTVGLVWQRERENDDLKKFAAFAENHGWAQ
jgi:DNA-binding transcriptional LysR family regulator